MRVTRLHHYCFFSSRKTRAGAAQRSWDLIVVLAKKTAWGSHRIMAQVCGSPTVPGSGKSWQSRRLGHVFSEIESVGFSTIFDLAEAEKMYGFAMIRNETKCAYCKSSHRKKENKQKTKNTHKEKTMFFFIYPLVIISPSYKLHYNPIVLCCGGFTLLGS